MNRQQKYKALTTFHAYLSFRVGYEENEIRVQAFRELDQFLSDFVYTIDLDKSESEYDMIMHSRLIGLSAKYASIRLFASTVDTIIALIESVQSVTFAKMQSLARMTECYADCRGYDWQEMNAEEKYTFLCTHLHNINKHFAINLTTSDLVEIQFAFTTVCDLTA